MKASEKISLLRTEMKARGVDHLLVPSDDYHMSEYVSDFFRARAYLSGFTGSAGTLIVSMNEAKLFTDGRYYIQAERQLAGRRHRPDARRKRGGSDRRGVRHIYCEK